MTLLLFFSYETQPVASAISVLYPFSVAGLSVCRVSELGSGVRAKYLRLEAYCLNGEFALRSRCYMRAKKVDVPKLSACGVSRQKI